MINIIKKNAPTWKKVTAFIIDLVLSFYVLGYVTALGFGRTQGSSFEIEGLPTIIVFLAVFLYFVLMNKYFSGTIGKKLLRI
ncbi:MAG: RDD family protein [Candidatus Blackburnbacteria bacterium]|nr:RDD family protein [Candidatus Blackburnbacteria bacterium]